MNFVKIFHLYEFPSNFGYLYMGDLFIENNILRLGNCQVSITHGDTLCWFMGDSEKPPGACEGSGGGTDLAAPPGGPAVGLRGGESRSRGGGPA
ncbi:unnamed protein product [Bubo scandiacus]